MSQRRNFATAGLRSRESLRPRGKRAGRPGRSAVRARSAPVIGAADSGARGRVPDSILHVPVPLPVDAHVPAVREALAAARAAVLVAPPGSGKTTRVPPALLEDGPVFLLQPRRVAARSIARRIAAEQGLTLGEDVGWQVRFERRFSARTRLLVATEGVLTGRLQSDPLLAGFRTIVLDEFHERSLHADLALAFARQAWRARHDLRLLVMSATLDARPVAGIPRRLPGDRGRGPATPGRRLRTHRAVARRGGARRPRRGRRPRPVLPSGGAGDPARAGRPRRPSRGVARPAAARPAERGGAGRRARAVVRAARSILATNVAETSLTVEGVTDVIDSGQQKVLRFDPASGLDRLVLERISLDSAEQRAGRAGRTGPGRVVRLWDPRDRLRPRREPEIERVDLAVARARGAGLGRRSAAFEWFETPSRGPPRSGAAAPRAARGRRERVGSRRRAKPCTGCRCTRGSRA